MKLLPGPLLLCLSKVPKSVTTMLKKITIFVLRWFHDSVSKSYVPSIKRIIGLGVSGRGLSDLLSPRNM